MTATNEQNTETQTSTVKAGVDPLEAVFAAARLKEQYRQDIALIAQRAINDGADVQINLGNLLARVKQVGYRYREWMATWTRHLHL